MTTLTRSEIVDSLVRDLDFSRTVALDFLEKTLEEVTRSLEINGLMKVSSFGSFNVRKKAKRIGRNPKTGEEAIITSRRSLSFRPSEHLKEAIVRRLSN